MAFFPLHLGQGGVRLQRSVGDIMLIISLFEYLGSSPPPGGQIASLGGNISFRGHFHEMGKYRLLGDFSIRRLILGLNFFQPLHRLFGMGMENGDQIFFLHDPQTFYLFPPGDIHFF